MNITEHISERGLCLLDRRPDLESSPLAARSCVSQTQGVPLADDLNVAGSAWGACVRLRGVSLHCVHFCKRRTKSSTRSTSSHCWLFSHVLSLCVSGAEMLLLVPFEVVWAPLRHAAEQRAGGQAGPCICLWHGAGCNLLDEGL